MKPASSSARGLAKLAFERIWIKGDYSFANEIFSEDCVHHFYEHLQSAGVPGPGGYIWIAESFHRAFSDLELSYRWSPIGEILHWSLIGVHRKSLFGVPATNTQVKLYANELYRCDGSKIHETWLFGNPKDFWGDSPNLHPLPN